MANVFLKNFYLEYNLLIIKFLVIHFEGLQLSTKDGSRKMMTKKLVVFQHFLNLIELH